MRWYQKYNLTDSLGTIIWYIAKTNINITPRIFCAWHRPLRSVQGFVLASDNLLTATAPGSVHWELFPSGDEGICAVHVHAWPWRFDPKRHIKLSP